MNDLFGLDIKPDWYYSDRKEMVKFIPPNVTRMLDVGCGEGRFSQIIKSILSVEVWGIEIYKAAAEKAKTVLDNVLIGDIERGEITLPDDYFDCILFFDVLEHLHDPWTVLQNIGKSLKERGYIVASIPNIRHYEIVKDLVLYRRWEYESWGVLDKTHLRFFTASSIIKMFERCGYNIITMEGIRGGKFPWKFGLLNRILLNSLDDMRYLQFACVATKV